MKENDVCPGCLEEGVEPPRILTRKPPPKDAGNLLSEAKTLTCTKPENPHTYPDDPQETSAKR
jgi:hypothetical protein